MKSRTAVEGLLWLMRFCAIVSMTIGLLSVLTAIGLAIQYLPSAIAAAPMSESKGGQDGAV
jgi:hypothetical protein